MTEYLDKKKLLDRICMSDRCREMIESGEFDAEDRGMFSERLADKALGEKDAEIAWLKELCQLQGAQLAKVSGWDNGQLMNAEIAKIKDRIAQQDQEQVPKASCGPEQDSVYQRLERLEDQQKRILGDLNEAYPAGTIRKTTGAKIKELDRRIEALEKGASYVLKVKEEKPAEPEMVICPHSNTCGQVDCNHKTPHHETPHCQSFCEYAPCDTSRCIPVKK